jgi:hypothetical protein
MAGFYAAIESTLAVRSFLREAEVAALSWPSATADASMRASATLARRMSTSGNTTRSSWDVKGSNDRPSQTNACCIINKTHSVRDKTSQRLQARGSKPEAPLICAVHCRKIYDDALFGNPKWDSEAVMEVACALYNLRVIYRHSFSKCDLLNFVSEA